MVGRPLGFPLKLKLRAAITRVSHGIGSSQVGFWMPLGSLSIKAFSVKKSDPGPLKKINNHFAKISPKNREIGHISGTAGVYPKLIGPMCSPNGGAYLIILPHPATSQLFFLFTKLLFWTEIWTFWYVMYTNKGCVCTKSRFPRFFFMEHLFFRNFLNCGILLPH